MFDTSLMIGAPKSAQDMMLNMNRAIPFMMMCEAVGSKGNQEQYDRLIRTARNMFAPKYYEYPERALLQIGIVVDLHQPVSTLDVIGV